MLLCEAAGHDLVVVETVGVGQSELEVASMVDFFLVLIAPSAGDELQGIKKGIVELADTLVVNRADAEYKTVAEKTRHAYQNALQLFKFESQWRPPVLTCSALEGRGVQEVGEMIETFIEANERQIAEKRAQQNVQWMYSLLHDLIERYISQNSALAEQWPEFERSVEAGEMNALSAVRKIKESMPGLS